MLLREKEISRFSYGGTTLWIFHRNLGGSRARRLLEKIDLHFRESGAPLIIDLREASFLDSGGGDVLETALLRHPDLAVVGQPKNYPDLPLSVRKTLDIARPSAGIEEALSRLSGPGHASAPWESRRRHRRFSVDIPVEIAVGSVSTAATLRDISLGGTMIGPLPPRLIREMEENSAVTGITIFGMEEDPFGKEVAKLYSSRVLLSRPVHLLPDQSGVGVQFDAPPGKSDS